MSRLATRGIFISVRDDITYVVREAAPTRKEVVPIEVRAQMYGEFAAQRGMFRACAACRTRNLAHDEGTALYVDACQVLAEDRSQHWVAFMLCKRCHEARDAGDSRVDEVIDANHLLYGPRDPKQHRAEVAARMRREGLRVIPGGAK